jgi:hypothetical protein
VPSSWGFSVFYDTRSRRRILAADVWSCIEHAIGERLGRYRSEKAWAYLWQGHEFYQAAQNPRFDSRPLLYYYSFLNAVKAFLIARGTNVPPRSFHGVSDPAANSKKRLRLEGQTVRVDSRGNQNDRILPELIANLGASVSNQSYRVLDLMAQIPAIHRTYTTIGRGRVKTAVIKTRSRTLIQAWRKGPCFAAAEITPLRDRASAWAIVALDRESLDSRSAIGLLEQTPAIRVGLMRVDRGIKDEFCFETAGYSLSNRHKAMADISKALGRAGVWSVLTPSGYRHYLGAIPQRYRLPQLASIYATMFYLGSVTRYRQYDYETILGGRYAWLVEEFLATEPTQFLYLLASQLTGVEVVQPMASRSGT